MIAPNDIPGAPPEFPSIQEPSSIPPPIEPYAPPVEKPETPPIQPPQENPIIPDDPKIEPVREPGTPLRP